MMLSRATGVQVGPPGVAAMGEVGEDEGVPGVSGRGDGEALLDAVGSGGSVLVDTGFSSSIIGAAQDARIDKNIDSIKAF